MKTKTVVGGGLFVLASVALLALVACGGGGGDSSSTESDVVWNSTTTPAGITIDYPAEWNVRPEALSVVISNMDEPPPTRDGTYAFFRVRRLANVNPSELTIDQWFDSYFSSGFSSAPTSREGLTVSGRDAVRIEILGVGTYVNIYIPDKQDVLSVTYGLDTPNFIADYEAILQSMTLTE